MTPLEVRSTVGRSRVITLPAARPQVLERLIEELEAAGYDVVFYNANPEVEADLRLVARLDPSWLLVTSSPAPPRSAPTGEEGALLGDAEV